MARKTVVSSQIASVGYDPHARVLEVEFAPKKGFKTGAVYIYKNFSSADYQDFVDAKSLGQHFAARIRPVFEFRRVEEPVPEENVSSEK